MLELIYPIIAFIKGNQGAVIWAALFALSEAIGLHPKIAASSVFQAIKNILVTIGKKLYGK